MTQPFPLLYPFLPAPFLPSGPFPPVPHNSRLLAFRPLLSKTVNRSPRIYNNTLKFLPLWFFCLPYFTHDSSCAILNTDRTPLFYFLKKTCVFYFSVRVCSNVACSMTFCYTQSLYVGCRGNSVAGGDCVESWCPPPIFPDLLAAFAGSLGRSAAMRNLTVELLSPGSPASAPCRRLLDCCLPGAPDSATPRRRPCSGDHLPALPFCHSGSRDLTATGREKPVHFSRSLEVRRMVYGHYACMVCFAFIARLTLLERAIAKCRSVCSSVCLSHS